MLIRKIFTAVLLASLPFYSQAFADPSSEQPLSTAGAPASALQNKVQDRYPGAKIRYVNLKEFEMLKSQYAESAIMIAAQNGTEAATPLAPAAPQAHPDSYDPCRGSPKEAGDHNDGYDGDFYMNWMANTQFDNGKDVLIFFAVIGVVVVAALVVYSLGFLWRAATAGFQCRVWSQWGLRFSYINDHTDTQVRRGTMSGGFFSLGYKIPSMTMALTTEVGHLDMDLKINATNEQEKLHGTYALLGPSFDIPFSQMGHSFQIELLAGTATDKDIGMMSTLRFGLDFRLNRQVRLGLSLGAALINVKTFEGVITDLDQVNFLSGAIFGYRF